MEKAEKIKVEGISIGDWFQARMVKWDYDDLDITPPMKIVKIEKDCVRLGFSLDDLEFEVFVDDLQPIPITAEMLEKSGFAHDKWSKKIWRYEDEESEVVYYIENGVLEITADDCKINLVCTSVAELQHALRLAKVGKEITL